MKLDRTRLGAAITLLAIAAISAWVTVGVTGAVSGLPDEDLVIFCAWALRGVAIWLLLGLLVSCLSAARLPMIGALLERVARAVCPAGINRLADMALRGSLTVGVSAGLVAGGLAASAAAATSPAGAHHPPTNLATLSLDWPGTHVAHVRPPEVAPAAIVTVQPSQSAEPQLPVSTPIRHRAESPPREHQPRHRAAISDTESVIVTPGDSLWSIAAAHLPPGSDAATVTRAWQAWWQANRAVIGTDPSVIRPGERLVSPTSLSRGGGS